MPLQGRTVDLAGGLPAQVVAKRGHSSPPVRQNQAAGLLRRLGPEERIGWMPPTMGHLPEGAPRRESS